MTSLAASRLLPTFPQVARKRRLVRYSSSGPQTLQDKLRHLMIHCAQPVAVVTTRLPQHHQGRAQRYEEAGAGTNRQGERDSLHEFHGATISSFSSIAMHPHPLVAFSLQLPSRLASALHAHAPFRIDTHLDTHIRDNLVSPVRPHPHPHPQPHFVINLLSAGQE